VLKRTRGFSLIEVLIALVILSMGITMLITMFTVGLKGVVINQLRTQAVHLAQDLMDEIVGKDFDENPDDQASTEIVSLGLDTGEGSTNRVLWDDVDDYLQLELGQAPRDVFGNTLSLYDGFTRFASVWYVDADLAESSISTELKRINVWVSHSDLNDMIITSLKTKSVY
jgi:MSHA pilin protein MshD